MERAGGLDDRFMWVPVACYHLKWKYSVSMSAFLSPLTWRIKVLEITNFSSLPAFFLPIKVDDIRILQLWTKGLSGHEKVTKFRCFDPVHECQTDGENYRIISQWHHPVKIKCIISINSNIHIWCDFTLINSNKSFLCSVKVLNCFMRISKITSHKSRTTLTSDLSRFLSICVYVLSTVYTLNNTSSGVQNKPLIALVNVFNIE